MKPSSSEQVAAIGSLQVLMQNGANASVVQALLNAMDGIAYMVDRDGVVVATSAKWDEFAQQNDGEKVHGKHVTGHSLFSQMIGDEVRSSYQSMHNHVLSGDQAYISFEYRCDAPDLRRTLRMSIHPVALPGCDPGLLYQSQILSEVVRPWMSLFEPARIVEYMRTEIKLPIVRMCSFCQRVVRPAGSDDAQDEWLEAEVYYRKGGPADVRISHGVCGECVS